MSNEPFPDMHMYRNPRKTFLLTSAYLQRGLVPAFDASQLKQAFEGMPADSERVTKRKFRKQWRKALRQRWRKSSTFGKRMLKVEVTDRYTHNQKPSAESLHNRKSLVLMNVLLSMRDELEA